MFNKAIKTEAKLRLALAGPSGSGKTYSALAIASHLADGSIALVDTEHGSASKYADLFNFDVLNLDPPFHPDRFLEAIRTAAKEGYNVIIIDSLSHAWNGTGGLLDIVDEISKRMKTSNTFAAWKDATPVQNKLIDGLIASDIHIIATMRSKQDYIQEVDDRGKSRIRKVGMAPIQRDGFEYEFDVFMELDIDNNAVVTKTRCPALTGKVITRPGKEVADTLREWLKGAPVVKREPLPREAQPPAENGKDKTQPRNWPQPWLDELVNKQFASNDFDAAGMLSKSATITPAGIFTPQQIAGWGKYYRASRDEGEEPQNAATVADEKLTAYLKEQGQAALL